MHRVIAITTVVIAIIMLSFACGDDTAPVVVEKVVDVEVPVDVVKEVPVEVVVEKEVIKEGPVEVVVEKIVEVEVAAPTPAPKDGATPETNRAALVALYNATDGPNWYDNDNLLSDMPLAGMVWRYH